MLKVILCPIVALFILGSCTLSGNSNSNGVAKLITGATKVGELSNVHVVNLIRAIGVPNHSVRIGRYKYYQWDYARMVGVSTILGGGSTTFYCKFSAETQRNRVKTLTWYGNQCDIFLDQINSYSETHLDLTIISEEDSKPVISEEESKPKTEISKNSESPLKKDENSEKKDENSEKKDESLDE